jgi:hypothetical protein
MVDKTDDGGFSSRSNFFGMVCAFSVGGGPVLVGGLPRNNLNGNLLILAEI